MALWRPLFAALLFTVALMLPASLASAATLTDRPLLFAFDGHEASAGRFTERNTSYGRGIDTIAIDDSCAVHQPPLSGAACEAYDPANGAVYVANGNYPAPGFVSKFHPDGTPWDFSYCGCSSLLGFSNVLGVAVDDSSAHPGRLYVSQSFHPRLSAYETSGKAAWPESLFPEGQVVDVALDPAGHPWLNPQFGVGLPLTEYESEGAPPAATGCTLSASDGHVSIDAAGNIYHSGAKYTKEGECSFSGPVTFDPGEIRDVGADNSGAGHVFTLHPTSLDEYAPCTEGEAGCTAGEKLAHTFDQNIIGSGAGIAYDPQLDRLYVGDGNRNEVEVFGPPTTGLVPDITPEAPSEVGLAKATFHAKINPQGVPNAYFFEYQKGTATAWEAVERCPEESLPADSTEHAVSCTATDLFGNTTYEVRVVAIDTANGLRAVSAPETFTTTEATEAPIVTIEDPTAITASAAHISGTIDAKGDSTFWWVEKSKDPACAGGTGFEAEERQYLPWGGISGPQPVSFELGGLLPNQPYCVRIKAENSFDANSPVGSEIKSFTTEAAPPSQVVTAFAAPRTQTTARLNGYANPEGSPLTYRFEYRKDEGEAWIPLAPEEDTSKARKTIIVSEELSGLTPEATYSFRFSAEDAKGQAQGEAKSFTTRTQREAEEVNPPPGSCPNEAARKRQHSAEYLPECRGIELVNKPDDGNQNVRALVGQETEPISPEGERAIWNVSGGAPGGNSGAGASFLAKRTGPTPAAPNGWTSSGLIPPGPQQAEPEAGGYELGATTEGLSEFIFRNGRGLVRIDEGGHQDVLQRYESEASRSLELRGADLSADGSRVVAVNDEKHTLEDIGTPGEPEVLSYLPSGAQPKCGVEGGGNSFIGSPTQWRGGYHLLSADGSRVYFQAHPDSAYPACKAQSYSGPWLLLERDREAGASKLVAPANTSNKLIRATPDGRSAYFISAVALDPADHNEHADVYRWDEETEKDTCLTCGVENEAGEAVEDADLLTEGEPYAALVSDDYSHVYFQSEAKLTPQATAGELNIYTVSGDVRSGQGGGSGKLRFVADPNERVLHRFGAVHWGAELSADGRVLVFGVGREASANLHLTTDRLAPSCPAASGEAHSGNCEELYRYEEGSSGEGSLECISCLRGATTTRSFGSRQGARDGDFRLSADGAVVAFATAQALLPGDVNGGADIYEWRDGEQRLLTDGVSDFGQREGAAAAVAGIDASGANVLLRLVYPGLTGFEQTGLANLYDARVGGGFEPPNPPAHCSEESCQGPLASPPPESQPGSLGFQGAGNLKEKTTRPRCRRGRVRRHGRCLKPHKHHHRHHRRRR